MEYEKEVAEKVWRGRRSGRCNLAVVEVFMREGAGAEGEVTIGKNRKKIITRRSQFKKMLISMENIGNIGCYQGKVKI